MNMVYTGNELQLPEIEIMSKNEAGGVVVYHIDHTAVPTKCPFCSSVNLSRFGVANRKMKDSPQYDIPVELVVKTHRYQCTKCGAVFTPSVPFAEDRSRITNRLAKQISDVCLRYSIAELAERYHVSVATISRITEAKIEEMEREWKYYTPEFLGLVDLKIGGCMKVVCVDMVRSGIVDIIDGDDVPTLIASLQGRFDFEETVQAVVIDFNKNHKDAIEAINDFVPVVVDKDHVLSFLLRMIRSDLAGSTAKTINLVLKNSEKLNEIEKLELKKILASDKRARRLYDFKNSFYAMYETKDYRKATAIFKQLSRELDPEDTHIDLLVRTIHDYYDEVFAYFNTPDLKVTTRNTATLVRRIEKKGNGFKFKNLRARILFGQTQNTAKKVVSTEFDPTKMSNITTGFNFGGFKTVTLGNYADINELLKIWTDDNDK